MFLNKIVVAEDDDAIAHMVNMALGDAGFLCLRARNGEEAINLVRVQSPDLLILDVMMPQLDGIEVTKRLRSDVLTSRTPILMLTALTSVDNKVAGLEAGADDYVTKPFDLRELAARAKAIIRASRRERERNPTTDLPGTTAASDQLARIVETRERRAVLHVQADRFRRFADAVGYSRAEKVVKGLGELVLSRSRSVDPDAPFVAHLGGLDFIVVCAPDLGNELAQELIDAFSEARDSWTDSHEDARDMRLAVGIVDTEGLAEGSDELTRRMASALRACKQRDGSSYVVWTPDIG